MSSHKPKFRDITAYVDKSADSIAFLRFLKENAAVDMAHQNMTKVVVSDGYANCPPAVRGKRLPMLYCAILQKYIGANDVYDFVQAYPSIVREYEAKLIAQQRPAAPPQRAETPPPRPPPAAVAAASGIAPSGAISAGGGGGRSHARFSGGTSLDSLFDQRFTDMQPINPKTSDQNDKFMSEFLREQEAAKREEQEFTARVSLSQHTHH